MILLCAACANEFKGGSEGENLHEIMCTQNVLDLTLAVTYLTYICIYKKKNKQLMA